MELLIFGPGLFFDSAELATFDLSIDKRFWCVGIYLALNLALRLTFKQAFKVNIETYTFTFI